MIKNYGLFWDRNLVHWGAKNNSGTLLGQRKGGKKKDEEIDFRDQRGIYALYDINLNPVYVGQAGGKNNANLFSRLKQHTSDHLRNRWVYFSWFGLKSVTKNGLSNRERKGAGGSIQDTLNNLEGILIAVLEPKLNKQGPKFSGNEYMQIVDENVKSATIQDVLEILNSQKK